MHPGSAHDKKSVMPSQALMQIYAYSTSGSRCMKTINVARVYNCMVQEYIELSLR